MKTYIHNFIGEFRGGESSGGSSAPIIAGVLGGVSFVIVVILLCAALLIRQLRKKKAYTIDHEDIHKSKGLELKSVVAETKETNAHADGADIDSPPPCDTVEIWSNPTSQHMERWLPNKLHR